MSPTQRSLPHLQALGFTAEVVEKRIPWTVITKDVCGADMLTAQPDCDRLCRHLVAHALGVEGMRHVVYLDEVALQAFLVVRAGIEDLPVVLALDQMRFLQGPGAAKRHAHENQSDGYLVIFAHTPPPVFEHDLRLRSSSGVTGT